MALHLISLIDTYDNIIARPLIAKFNSAAGAWSNKCQTKWFEILLGVKDQIWRSSVNGDITNQT